MTTVIGVANSYADLKSAVETNCVAAGFTLSSNILNKGALYAQLDAAYFRPGNTMQGLAVWVGNGQSGSSLTNAAYYRSRLGEATEDIGSGVVFPCNYYLSIHDNPDEVYLIVNYNVSEHQWLAFGCSPAPGIDIDGGTGNWSAGTFGVSTSNLSSANTQNRYLAGSGINTFIGYDFGGGGNSDSTSAAIFWSTTAPGGGGYPVVNSIFHTGTAAQSGWSADGNSEVPNANVAQSVITSRLPNAWNGQTILQPIQITINVASNKTQIVGELAHSRYCKVTNYEPGDIITLGSDQWIVFPFYKKGAEGNGSAYHTFGYGWALKYEAA